MAVTKTTIDLPDKHRIDNQVAPALAFIESGIDEQYPYKGVVVQGTQITHYIKNDNGKRFPNIPERLHYFITGEKPYSATPLLPDTQPSLEQFIIADLRNTHRMDNIIREDREKLEISLPPFFRSIIDSFRAPNTLATRTGNDALASRMTQIVVDSCMDLGSGTVTEKYSAHPDYNNVIKDSGLPHDKMKEIFDFALLRSATEMFNLDPDAPSLPPTLKEEMEILSKSLPPSVPQAIREHWQAISTRTGLSNDQNPSRNR